MFTKVGLIDKPYIDRKRDVSFQSLALLSNPALTSGLRALDTEKMMGVTVIDVGTAIGPRTAYDTVKKNPFAGIETFIRESSGLIINCLIPGVIAWGYAALMTRNFNKEFDISAHKVWANTETIDAMTKVFKDNDHNVNAFVKELVGGIKGLKGTQYVALTEKEKDSVTKIFTEILAESKDSKARTISKTNHYKLYSRIGSALEATENYILEIKGKDGKIVKTLGTSLDDFVRDSYSMAKVFASEKVKPENLDKVVAGMKKYVGRKTALGLATILGIAMSVQYLNRQNTKKLSGKDGAPIYQDYTQKNYKRETTPEEKRKLNIGKVFSILGLVAIAGLSIGKAQFKNLKSLLEFKKFYPTLDQCRIVSATTFASRMAASEDTNELKESTVRDYFTFLSFYVLGEFVAKGYAHWKNKAHDLINVSKAKENFSNLFSWFKNGTAEKTHNEIIFEEAKKAKIDLTHPDYIKEGVMDVKAVLAKLSEAAQKRLAHLNTGKLAGLGWSLLAVGLAIPAIMKKMTDSSEAKRKAKLVEQPQQEKSTQTRKNGVPMTGHLYKTKESSELFRAFIK